MTYSHPRFGHEIRVEQKDREVSITLVANTPEQAVSVAEALVMQIMAGVVHFRVGGNPRRVEVSHNGVRVS